MAEFFNKIAEEVEKASEELYALFTGESASGGGGGGSNANFDATDGDSGSFPHEFDLDDMNLDGMSEEQIQEMLAEDLMKNNPLQDLADGVTRNIMAGQVRRVHSCRAVMSRTNERPEAKRKSRERTGFHAQIL